MTEVQEQDIQSHWYADVPGALAKRIRDALEAAGKDLEHLRPEDLALVDEFHIRGRDATTEMLELAAIQPNEHLIDVGSGIGGPARHLAAATGCRVSGVDLTPEYVDVANRLAEWAGLDDRVRFQQGNALALPFADDTFDVAWTQHISMNIPDKSAFFAEMRRVVRPGGRLVIYDPIKGDDQPLELPVPWSRDGRLSFLIDAAETRAILEDVGLEVATWRDASAKTIQWFEANAAATPAPNALGIHLLLGPEWPTMARNMAMNVRAGRLKVVQVVARV